MGRKPANHKKKNKHARNQRAKAEREAGAAVKARLRAGASADALTSPVDGAAFTPSNAAGRRSGSGSGVRGRSKSATRRAAPAVSRCATMEDVTDAPAPRGLVNLGNTCFFNSAMQNVARMAAVREYFLRDPPTEWESGTPFDAEADERPMTTAMRMFMSEMWMKPKEANSSGPINPSFLFTEVGKKNPRFKGRNQQDAHEVLRCIFDGIVDEEVERLKEAQAEADEGDDVNDSDSHVTGPDVVEAKESLNADAAEAPDSSSEGADSTDDATQSEARLEKEKPKPTPRKRAPPTAPQPTRPSEKQPLPQNVIDGVVGGNLVSAITCCECGHRSSVVEPFLDLSVPLVPRAAPKPKDETPRRGIRKSAAKDAAATEKTDTTLGSNPNAGSETLLLDDNALMKEVSKTGPTSSTTDPAESPTESVVTVPKIAPTGVNAMPVAKDSTANVEKEPDVEKAPDAEKAPGAEKAPDAKPALVRPAALPSQPPPPPPPPPPPFALTKPSNETPLATDGELPASGAAAAYAELNEVLERRKEYVNAAEAVATTTETATGECDGLMGPLPEAPPSPSLSTAACGTPSPVDHSDASDFDEAQVVPENTTIVLGQAPTPTHAPSAEATPSDDEEFNAFEGFSLFDDLDSGDEGSSSGAPPATAGVNGNASTAGTNGTAPTNQPITESTKATPKKAGPVRRPNSMVPSWLSGFGSNSLPAAPHGYESVVGSLESFTVAEVLEGDNAYGCEECTRREALRQARAKLVASEALAGHQRKAGMADVRGSRTIEPADVGSETRNTIEEPPQPGSKAATDAADQSHEPGTARRPEPIRASDLPPASTGEDVLMSSPVTSSESGGEARSEIDTCSTGRSEADVESLDDEERAKAAVEKIPTVRSRAEKRLMVKDAPRALIIHLKRFTQVGLRGTLRKISGHVEFPLELNMSPFVYDESATATVASEPGEGKTSTSTSGRKRRGTTVAASKHRYLLTGVCVHGGSLHGGHYTAYVREGVHSDFRGGWFYCSDSRVQRVTEKEVLESEAFMLFYERIEQ